jgi:glycosyltransferase involved in cell wall biosynthesis
MTKPRWAFIHPFQMRLQRGIETYLWELTSTLASSGVDVDILTWAGPFERPGFLHPGVQLKKAPGVRYYQSLAAIPFYIRYLVQNRYDHVFLHFAGYGEGLSLHLARKLVPIPHSVVFHFPPSLVPHRYHEFKRWGFEQSANHLIAVSHSTAREVQQWAKRSCRVIGHGVAVDRFRPEPVLRARTRVQLGLSPECPVLITVAALEERKGVQWVIRALPKVLTRFPETRYLVVGDGPFRRKLEDLTRDLKLDDCVLFLGFQKDVAPFMNASDLAFLLSSGEASPISLLEYAACSLPVVTSCHDPFPELIQPEWGEMVDEQDPETVSRKIMTLLSDPDLRKRKAAHGREWITRNHAWDQVAQEYLHLIESSK